MTFAWDGLAAFKKNFFSIFLRRWEEARAKAVDHPRNRKEDSMVELPWKERKKET
jgi:hypothetical protein